MSRSREEQKNIGGPAGDLGTGGGGTNDVNSGGGAGAGIPDGDTAMRNGEAVTRGDPQVDREKLFPESLDDTHKTPDKATKRPQEAIPPPKGG